MKILGSSMQSEIIEVYEEKVDDATISGCMLCFRCEELCPYEDCLKIKWVVKPS